MTSISNLPKTPKPSFFLGVALSLAALSLSASAATVNFTTPGATTWTVPAGVTTVTVVATGAGGGGGYGQAGGKGGVVTSTLTVTPAQVLNLYVGGHGGGSAGGGGAGGGSTNIDAGTANQIIAGGGGGGAGGGGVGGNGNGGRGGDAGNGNHPTGGFGGSNGVGGAGGAGGAAPGVAGSSGNGGPGGAGSGSVAGAGSGTGAGAAGAGGSGCWCGSGGGGYGGGGSGGQGSFDDAGGGGGGSTGPAGSVYTLATNAGASHASGGDGAIAITYTLPAPSITAVAPASGSPAGGMAVSVSGTGFLTGATVVMGGVACTGVSVVSGSSITCTSGAHAAGAVQVVVTNTDAQTGTLSNGFTYSLSPQAALTAVVSSTAIRMNDTATLSTTGGSGTGAVAYALSSGPCTLVGASLTGTGEGSCLFIATKVADSNYQLSTASVTVTVSTPKFLVAPAFAVGIAGSNLNPLNLGGTDGPALSACLRDSLRTVMGADAQYQGQSADGVVRVGQTGQTLSFYALDVGGTEALGSGIHLGNSNALSLSTNCGTFQTVPAVSNLPEFGALLSNAGLAVQINPQGVLTVSVGGVWYVARPGYLVALGAPGAASLVMGPDSLLRFTDSGGGVQILYPAFLDTNTLGNQIAQVVGGSIVIQTDGRAVLSMRDGARYVLTPDLVLGGVPPEQAAAMWWPDGANRFRYRTSSIFNTSQGFTVKAFP